MITRSLWAGIVVVAMSLVFPPPVTAQEAAIVGTVMDSTGGVLPGVTVTAAQAERSGGLSMKTRNRVR